MSKLSQKEIYNLIMELNGDADEPLHYEDEEENFRNLQNLCGLADFLCEKICEIQRESKHGERFQRYTKWWIEETIESFKDELDRDAGLI